MSVTNLGQKTEEFVSTVAEALDGYLSAFGKAAVDLWQDTLSQIP
jgi:hypothetical protein